MAEYKVQFEVFEGPLDLLLYLVKKEEVDIYQVNLTKIAAQFIEYIELMRELDLDVAGEFLVMASTLMYIKSRELLPADQQVQAEGEEDETDPRWELIRQLVEYKKFKDAAAQLHRREAEQENIFPRLPGRLEFESTTPPPRPEVSLFDLISAVSNVLKRFQQREGARDIQTPVKVGGRWLASFEHPALSQCTVEKLGFEIIIAGPTEESVFARSGEFRERGALITRGPEQEEGVWKLYLDDVGARTGNTITS